MSDSRGQQPHDADGRIIVRAQGIPLAKKLRLGSSTGKYRDIFDISTMSRAFHGISCYNPDSANDIWIAIGIRGCGDLVNDRAIIVPPLGIATFDNQCFGRIFEDPFSGFKASRVRACLVTPGDVAAVTGTAASGTINYSVGPLQPADGNTVTLNGRVYEFSSDMSVIPGNIKVDIAATADLSWTAFKNAVNANDSEVLVSINTGTHIVTITSNWGGADGNAQTFSDGGGGGTITGATFSGAGNLAGGLGVATRATFHLW